MFDFARFAQDHRIHYITGGHHHAHTGWYQLHCPLCGGGRSGYHLGCSMERGVFSCWRCGVIKATDAIRALLSCSPERAKDILRQYIRGEGKKPPRAYVRRRKVHPPVGLGAVTAKHIKYLTDELPQGRGFTRKEAHRVIEDWGLGGTQHLSGLWSWRLVGPIKDVEQRVVAYVGRAVSTNAKPKYRVTERDKCGAAPETFLYGIDKVPGKSVVVVEGPGDAWRIGPGAVATDGIGWHEEQAMLLRRFTTRTIIYDPEAKAQAKAQELANWLSVFDGVTNLVEDLPSDPGSLNSRMVKRIRTRFLGD